MNFDLSTLSRMSTEDLLSQAKSWARSDKEELLSQIRLKKEAVSRKAGTTDAAWARSFAGRPVEFIAEVMGPTWLDADWAAWRVFVKSLFGLPLADDQEREVHQRCTELDASSGPHREAFVPVGRRGGKSRILAMIAVYKAVCFDWTPYLAPGQFGYISIFSDTMKHAGEIMNYVKGAFFHPRLRGIIQRSLEETLELSSYVRIQVVVASIAGARSRTVIVGLCDEIAFWRSEETAANPDVEILRSLRPAMSTIPGSLLLCASSRYARRGVLWEAFRDYYGKPDGPLVWSADTVTMHPSIDQDFIRDEYEKDSIAAAAEYGLDWRSDVAEFIQRERVDALVIRGRYELPYNPLVRYYAFVDPAGGSGEDSMTLAIAHRDPKTGHGVLDLLREARPQFDPEDKAEEFVRDIKAYHCQSVTGDGYAADWCANAFRKRGVGYHTSELSASDLYRESLPLLNGNRVELLDDKRFINQVCALERTTTRLGRETISHPPRQHDDLANVGLAALVMAAGSKGTTMFSAEAAQKLEMMSRM